jgi:hypothetical protein
MEGVAHWCRCQGTLVVGPTLKVSESHNLNKGGASDLAHRVSSAMPTQRQAVSDIYTRDHSRYYLLIVTLLA